MNAVELLSLVNLFFGGILTGVEFVVYYGVRTPLASLDERPQALMRQALIRRLRIAVPAIFMSALFSAAVLVVASGPGGSLVFRAAGLLALLAWASVTLPGTARVNAAILEWSPDALPRDWREQVRRWERFAFVRPWAAVIAFGLFLMALGVGSS
jgi:uncharacterized membrane protein